MQQPNGTIQPEPFSGQLGMAFPLGFNGNRGDIFISEQTGQASDQVRFPGNGFMYFFSLLDGASDGIADVPALPGPDPNLPFFQFQEVGPEGNNFLQYSSNQTTVQVGGDGSTVVQYLFQSDGLVPEPSTFILLGLGAPALAGGIQAPQAAWNFTQPLNLALQNRRSRRSHKN